MIDMGEVSREPLRRGANIAERLMQYSVAVLEVVGRLRKSPSMRHVASQWMRSSTAIGAAYEEARAAESRGDFIHKVGIAAKEAREASYWAEMVHRAGWLDVSVLVREGRELTAILGACARTARANAEKP